jgi:hypothetical protein
MHARDGQKSNINHGALAPFLTHDIYPSLAMPGLADRVRQKIIVNIFILAGQEAIITIFTFFHIDD